MKHFFRVVSFLFLILATESVVLAQQSVGTWKLDPGKSKFTTGLPMKENTVTITKTGGEDQIEGMALPLTAHPLIVKSQCPQRAAWENF